MGLFTMFRSRPDADPLDYMLGRAASDPALRPRFYRLMLESSVFVPGEIQGDELFIRPYTLDERKTLLFFSSRKLASVLRDRPGLVKVPGGAILETCTAFESVILNYASRNQKEFTRSEIRALLDGSIFKCDTAMATATLIIGQPKDYPVRLMNELSRTFPLQPEILAAYIAQVARDEHAPVAVIALATTGDEETFGAIRENVINLARKLDVARLDVVRLADDPLGEYLLAEVKPFYEAEGR